jgi:site-specific DNA-methyltransferase (adenine-specific)
MENFIKVGQAAKVLKVSSETLRRWDKSGKFLTMRHPINNYRVYSEAQVEELRLELQKVSEVEPILQSHVVHPFFESGYGKLYNQDAVEYMKGLADGSVDLIFADPPYNIKKAEWDTFASQKAYVEWSMTWIREAERVLSKSGSLYICGFSEILADLKWAASPLFKGCKWLVWFYRNKGNLGKDWGRSHESILHFRKSEKFIFNIDEVRVPYNQHTLKYPKRTQAETSQFSGTNGKEYVWEPNPLGAKPKDVLEIPTISNGSWEKTIHTTQKPVELLRKIVLSSSNIGSVILDPFGGSGTTFAVAEAYQRNWLGTELDLAYCEVIKERVNDTDHISRIISSEDEKASQKRRVKLRG